MTCHYRFTCTTTRKITFSL